MHQRSEERGDLHRQQGQHSNKLLCLNVSLHLRMVTNISDTVAMQLSWPIQTQYIINKVII